MRGFTLLEAILYSALFSIIIAGAWNSVYALTESADRTLTKAHLNTEGAFLVRKIQLDIARANRITSPVSTTTLSNQLWVTTLNDTRLSYALIDSQLNRGEGSSSAPLSDPHMIIDSLTFTKSEIGGVGSLKIMTSFTIGATTSQGRWITEPFSFSSYLFP